MGTLWQDIRYGLRMLAKSPGFTGVVVLILAVGIGANTAVFSVVNAVLLRPLPYKNSHDLVTIREHGVRSERILCGRPHLSFLRENNHVFESLAGFCGRLFYVTGIEKPHEIHTCEVTLGFRPENVLTLEIRLPYAKYTNTAQRKAFFQPLLERLRALPHVHSAALCDGFGVTDALGEGGCATPFSLSGQTDTGLRHTAKWRCVTPDLFTALGVRFLRGQTLSEQDPDGVVIDEILAQKCLPGVNPVGQRLITEDRASGHDLHTILGVVDTVRSFDILALVQGTVYAMATEFENWPALLIRTDGDPMRLAPAVRQQVAELEKDPVIRVLEPLGTTLSQMLAPWRFVMILLSLFAGIALALATIGVYGLLQYSTTQQTHDIGIRMALGARKTDILRAVVGHGLKLTVSGVAVGLAGAFVLTRLVSSFLYGVTRTDPVTFACVSLVLAAVALVASYLPARRAARIDPMAALRYE